MSALRVSALRVSALRVSALGVSALGVRHVQLAVRETKGAHTPGHDMLAVVLHGACHANDATAGSHGPEVAAAHGRD